MKYFLILLYPIFLVSINAAAQKEYKKSLSGISRVEIETQTNIRIVKSAGSEIKITAGCTDCGSESEHFSTNAVSYTHLTLPTTERV